MEQCPEPFVEMHPELASKYQIENGERVKLSTPRDKLITPVKITKAIRTDTMVVPYHCGTTLAVTQLTTLALYPSARMPEFNVCALTPYTLTH